MLEEYFVDEYNKITTTRNKHGDYIYSATASKKCRYREENQIVTTGNGEQIQTDAQIWVSNSDDLNQGDVVKIDDLYYQIEKRRKARRLGETDIQFVKCDLRITSIGIS